MKFKKKSSKKEKKETLKPDFTSIPYSKKADHKVNQKIQGTNPKKGKYAKWIDD